jgi:glutamate racemase
MHMDKSLSRPIGIFDSGVGGLTVAHAIRQILPSERLIYFGDTAHLPYGDKSKETVMGYSARITRHLIEQECKVIVIACNTASANAFETVVAEAGDKTLVLDVINPVVEYVTSQEYKRIGVIGTKGTINSGTYVRKIIARNPHLSVASLATPMFVPMIEEGFIFDDISNAIIRSYLSRPELSRIDALILGCTHFPIIKNQINKFFNFSVDIIDSSLIVANVLRDLLATHNRLNQDLDHTPQHQFMVSDYTSYFQIISKLFFEEDIVLEKVNIFN